MEFNTFDSVKIGLASPDTIHAWSHGEVTKPETINYRTLKPERDGLFCERIFGPTKDWECNCGKYKRIRFKGKICDKCGVEVTRAKVRRERMGHIDLATPVSHIWYFKGIPSRIGTLLKITPKELEKVLYFAAYVVTDPGEDTELHVGQVLDEKEYNRNRELYGNGFKANMGAEPIRELLERIDLQKLHDELKEEYNNNSSQQIKTQLTKRIEVVDAFLYSGNRPEWMILTAIPVIPPELRPMVQLDGGRFATSDLNDLYRRVINRNNRLRRLQELKAPDIIVRNEKRMLQEAVDALIDNGRRGRPVTGPNNRALKSLSDMLRGKQGRFRQNLLGKRVDYSGRSVIVVGPELKLYQCGLPKEMALELFKPFVMKRLVETGASNNIKSARKMVERAREEVWDALEFVIKDHPVLLNRAPTLHRLGIQAFEPVLVEGRAIKLHPLVCTAFNADFDGDQMAVHVPLSCEAQAEARFLMLSANNLLKPQDGRPVTVPTQDMVLGSYYLTIVREYEDGAGKAFKDFNEALMAYADGVVGLHAPIKVRNSRMVNGELKTKLIDATVGQIIFNDPIPQDLGFVDRTDPERALDLEVTFTCGKKQLGQIIDKSIRVHGTTRTAELIDCIKAQGYKYSTKGSISVAVSDAVIPESKKTLIDNAEKDIDVIRKSYLRGRMSDNDRYKAVIKIWEKTKDDVTADMQKNLDRDNSVFMMADSGARGSLGQISQLAGMCGLIANTSGRTIEIPIRANYREGLNIIEYFILSRGARKGLADTALRTADSGYLTRRLVDVSQDVIIREPDCGTTEGITVHDLMDGDTIVEPLVSRLIGRYPLENIINPTTGEVMCDTNTMMTEALAKKIVAAGVTDARVRSILGCRARYGVCAKCYGANLANGKPVKAGEAVGVIAAQSIGEPGTQLTMRTFHTGGVAGDDITQGLPRVEELFESRKPKRTAEIASVSGKIRIDDSSSRKSKSIYIDDEVTGETLISYPIVYGARVKVHDGDHVEKGDSLTEGSRWPQDILRILGAEAVENYITTEVQKVYRLQSVDINDKHIEVIVRQMMKKIRVTEPGSTNFLQDSMIDKGEFYAANAEIRARIEAGETELAEAKGEQALLGITKAALATDSFLSAASFQETTKVLTEAAIKGKSDPLLGLKENVIIGKLLPAGTGMDCYSGMTTMKAANTGSIIINLDEGDVLAGDISDTQ